MVHVQSPLLITGFITRINVHLFASAIIHVLYRSSATESESFVIRVWGICGKRLGSTPPNFQGGESTAMGPHDATIVRERRYEKLLEAVAETWSTVVNASSLGEDD